MSNLLFIQTDRAQSATVGVVLLTAVVIVITAVVGGVVLSGIETNSQAPIVDIRGNATSQHVMVTHNGGDSLPRSDVDIITDGNRRVRQSLDSYTQRIGSDNARFESGDSWRRSNAVTGDRITLMAIHTPSNTVLDQEKIDVRVTSFARFTYDPQNPTPTLTVDFDASNSEFEGGTVDTYVWDFNNGDKTANGKTASYSFPDDGEYPVTLTITASDGRTATRSKTVTVYNENPTASFTYSPPSPDTGETISFDGTGSSDSDGSVKSYNWDWDNDGTFEDTGSTPDHSYSASGDKTVTLRVIDDDGDTGLDRQTVTVGGNAAPTARFTASPNPADTGESITFDASGSSDPESDSLTYEWDWTTDGTTDDTTTDPMAIQSHTYSSIGTYTVELTVTDGNGNSDTTTKDVTITQNAIRYDGALTTTGSNSAVQFDITNVGSSFARIDNVVVEVPANSNIGTVIYNGDSEGDDEIAITGADTPGYGDASQNGELKDKSFDVKNGERINIDGGALSTSSPGNSATVFVGQFGSINNQGSTKSFSQYDFSGLTRVSSSADWEVRVTFEFQNRGDVTYYFDES